jgi:hypothetical protein
MRVSSLKFSTLKRIKCTIYCVARATFERLLKFLASRTGKFRSAGLGPSPTPPVPLNLSPILFLERAGRLGIRKTGKLARLKSIVRIGANVEGLNSCQKTKRQETNKLTNKMHGREKGGDRERTDRKIKGRRQRKQKLRINPITILLIHFDIGWIRWPQSVAVLMKVTTKEETRRTKIWRV